MARRQAPGAILDDGGELAEGETGSLLSQVIEEGESDLLGVPVSTPSKDLWQRQASVEEWLDQFMRSADY